MGRLIIIGTDDSYELDAISTSLNKAGFEVASAASGLLALKMVRETIPDLLILKVELPGLSGLEVCKAMKVDPQVSRMPIIMAAEKAEEIDRIVALELGVDDYLTKPFSPRELTLRVQTILRRVAEWKEIRKPVQNNIQPVPLIVVGNLKIDLNLCRVYVDNEIVQLSPIEYKLLVALVESPGKVHSREKLLREVWRYIDRVETRTVNTSVLRLRDKLGSAGNLLVTVRGFGYRLAAR